MPKFFLVRSLEKDIQESNDPHFRNLPVNILGILVPVYLHEGVMLALGSHQSQQWEGDVGSPVAPPKVPISSTSSGSMKKAQITIDRLDC